jgi:hypothetical protein
MNKSSVTSSLKHADFNEDWSSHPAIEWLSSHKKIFLWGFLALIALLILTYRITSLSTLNAEHDFFQAQTDFTQFQQESVSSEDSATSSSYLEQLEAIMQRHPELKPRYEGPLAQTLLITGQTPQAQVFVEDIFKRTQPDHLQFYQDYSQASLLISQGHYSDALQQTQQLQSSLDQLNEQTHPILYVFNLIRLAMLYQQTGQSKEELQTWKQLQNQPQRVEAVFAASQVYKIGQASLNQYIEERKKALR